jgi:hypothetical protein
MAHNEADDYRRAAAHYRAWTRVDGLHSDEHYSLVMTIEEMVKMAKQCERRDTATERFLAGEDESEAP